MNEYSAEEYARECELDESFTESFPSISGETLKSQLKLLQTDIEVLDHKIKQYVNHLRYTRKYKTRAIKKAIVKQFGKQITDIDVRSKELEKEQKGEVQPSTDKSNANFLKKTGSIGPSFTE